MSDNEDYYTDSDASDVSDVDEKESKNIVKKSIINKSITIDDFNEDEDDAVQDDEDEDEEHADEDEADEDDDDVGEDEDNDEYDYIDKMQEGGASDDKKIAKKAKVQQTKVVDDDDDDYEDDDEDDEDDENYLQKFNEEISKNYIHEFHPECLSENFEEIINLSKVVRDSNGIIIDPFHKTIPFLTKYEKTRIIGQRAKQIENGAKPFINIPDTIIDSYIIAELELQQKKIPFIIRRPLPSGAFEYWNVKDLDNIAF